MQSARPKSSFYKNVLAVNSLDPNEKSGTVSNPDNSYIRGDRSLPYRIDFENIASATAPAQQVIIADTLDAKVFDLSSVSFTSFGFGDINHSVTPGVSAYTTLIDLRPLNDVVVRTDMKMDIATGVLTVKFLSLDPATLEIMNDPEGGFLPPNVDYRSGQGFVMYSVSPKTELPTGTELKNKAHIFFDNNEAIVTNTFTNLIDKTKPAARVQSAVENSMPGELTVTWEGNDAHAGIQSFDIYRSVDDGPFELWLGGTTETEVNFEATAGSAYGFYAVSRDYAGNIENGKNGNGGIKRYCNFNRRNQTI